MMALKVAPGIGSDVLSSKFLIDVFKISGYGDHSSIIGSIFKIRNKDVPSLFFAGIC